MIGETHMEVVAVAMTSADLPPALLSEAKDILGVKSNREALERALQSVVTRHHQLLAIRGMAEVDLDPDAVKIEYPLDGDDA
ncbi:hypothetical protein [Curtobacterium sp. MCSS17_016]|uniref:hypothetical protein n=1 Tax=Curtobacterium sp. MCSS17_016 TaxID=2175644 RepID=UPI000DB67B47|nr:hypothetical protein [Curtobacterium sp. MCSS17_016]WIE80975.1 hypothetical protein DEJ19_020880 [Curtobacterium sp. MCSS17_016]